MGDKQPKKKWELVEEKYPEISVYKLKDMEKGQMLEFLDFIINTYGFDIEEQNRAIDYLTKSNEPSENALFLYTLAAGAKLRERAMAPGNYEYRQRIFQHLDSIDTAGAYLALNPEKGGKKYRKKRTKRRTRGKKRTKSRSKSRRKSKRRKRRKSRRRK